MHDYLDLQTPESEVPKREFSINNDVSAEQVGRVFKLSNDKFGSTYLIDVTDSPDPTTADPPDEPMLVSQILKDELASSHYEGSFNYNNGVISLITKQLDENHRSRAYLGIEMVDPNDPEAKEITSYILDSAGFQRKQLYVPFSFDSIKAATLVKNEILSATGTDLTLPQLEDGEE